MKIKKATILKTDLTYQYLPANYWDAFKCSFHSNKDITADEFQIAFWTHSPKWIIKLFKFRDWIVKPFGIQKGYNEKDSNAFETCIRSGGSYRFVSVPTKSNHETVLCANDKHLKMYFSVKILDNNSTKHITISTVVQFHNWLGRAYFYIIYPFHHIVVRAMIRDAIRRIK